MARKSGLVGILAMVLVFGVVGVEVAQAQQNLWDVTVWGVLNGERITEAIRVTANNASHAQNVARQQFTSRHRGIQQVGVGSPVSMHSIEQQSWWSVQVWGVLNGQRIEEVISVTANNASHAQNVARQQFTSRYRGIQQVGTGSAIRL